MLATLLRQASGRIITTDLLPADSVSTDNGASGSWTSGGVSPNNAIDGSDSTFAQFTGTSTSATSGSLTLTYPVIEASEILAVRLRIKGQGGSGGSNFHTNSLTSAADATAKPSGTHVIYFNNGGSLATADTGLGFDDYDINNANIFSNFDASTLVGSSSGVLDYWAGGVRLVIQMSDYNLGGTGGKNYSPLLQVQYRV